MDWWYAVPQPFETRIANVDHVVRGEYFSVIPFFNSFAISADGTANLVFDVEVERPDGSIHKSVSGCKGITGKAPASKPVPAQAIINLHFEEEDPYGTYTVNVSAKDATSGKTTRRSITIEQVPFSMDQLTQDECERVFINYVSDPDPSRAFAAFLQTGKPFLDEGYEPVWSAIWFYKTIVENNDYLIPHLLEFFPTATYKQQKDIYLLLSLLPDAKKKLRVPDRLKTYKRIIDAGRIPQPYGELANVKQLDMLWAEFFATGRIRPLRQLTTALELGKSLGTLEKIKSGVLDREDSGVARAAMQEAVFQSALISLREHCAKSPLAFQYCVGIIERDMLSEEAQETLTLLLESIAREKRSPDR